MGNQLPLDPVSRLRSTEITLTMGEFLDISPYASALVSKSLIREPTEAMKRASEKRKLKRNKSDTTPLTQVTNVQGSLQSHANPSKPTEVLLFYVTGEVSYD